MDRPYVARCYVVVVSAYISGMVSAAYMSIGKREITVCVVYYTVRVYIYYMTTFFIFQGLYKSHHYIIIQDSKFLISKIEQGLY